MEDDYLKRLNRSMVTVGSLLDQDPRAEAYYWLTKKPVERLIALEQLRMRLANYDSLTSRLQRVFTVTQRSPG
jgi:hypothetical protein